MAISQLASALRQLNAEKVAERKSNLKKVQDELKCPEVLAVLDKNTDEESGTTWKTVLRSVKDYILKEAYRLEEKDQGSSRNQSSSAALTRRDQEWRSCSSVFRIIVQLANKRGPRLPCNEAMKHIAAILREEFICQFFVIDYTNVLIKDILPVRSYRCSLDSNLILNLLARYCHLWIDPPRGVDRNLLSQAVYHLIVTGSSIGCLNSEQLFTFFKKALGNARCEKNNSPLENLTLALVNFSKSVVNDCRIQLCHLGECIIESLLNVLRNKPSDTAKCAIAEFLRLQIAIHNPKGVVDAELGAYACDHGTWQSLLKKMYHDLIQQLDVVGTKGKYSPVKDYSAKSEIIALAVEVCHVVFHAPSSSMDVTQLSHTQHDKEPSLKKRRVQFGLEAITSLLQNPNASYEIIPWLQLLFALLNKYPETISVNEIPLLLDQLLQLYTNCKQNEVKGWVLKSCHAVAKSFCYWRNPSTDYSKMNGESANSNGSWQDVWDLAIRTVCINQCSDECHYLLTFMLKNKLVKPKPEFLNLYCPGSSNQLSPASLQTLATYIENFKIPLHGKQSFLFATNTDGDYSSHQQILKWIFCQDDDSLHAQSCLSPRKLNLELAPLAAQIICALSLQNPYMKCRDIELHFEENLSNWQWIDDLEVTLYQNMFPAESKSSMEGNSSQANERSTTNAKILPSVWYKVMEITMKNAGSVLEDGMSSELETKAPLLSQACLMMHILQGMSQAGVITCNDPAIINMIANIKKILEVLSKYMKKLCISSSSSQQQCLLALLPSLRFVFLSLVKGAEENEGKTNWLEDVVPKSLNDFMFDVLKKKSTYSSDNQSLSTIAPRFNRSEEVVDDFDHFDDSDIPISGSTPDDNSNKNVENYVSILNPSLLTESQSMVLEAAKIVGALHKWVSKCQPGCQNHIVKAALNVFESESMDLNNTFDLQLCFQIFKDILTGPSWLDSNDMFSILNFFRRVLNSNYRTSGKVYKDYEVTSECLDLIIFLIPRIFNNGEDANAIERVRSPVFHILKTLWGCWVEDGNSFAPQEFVKRLLKASTTFLKNDIKKVEWDDFNPQSRMLDELHNFYINSLKDVYQSVRLYAACHVNSLFALLTKNHSRTAPGKIFAIVYRKTSEGLSIQGDISDKAVQDEKSNRQLILLMALKCTALSSVFCEKQVVFALLQTTVQFQMPLDIVEKVIKKLSEELSYPSSCIFLETHLGYLIHHWLNQEYSLTHFPFCLLKCNTFSDFCKKYCNTILPFILDRRDVKMVQLISRELNVDVKELMKQCLPQMFARIIPWFAASTHSLTRSSLTHKQTKLQQQARRCYELLEETFTCSTVQNALGQLLVDVVIHIMEMLVEEKNDSNLSTVGCMPSPNPPYFEKKFIDLTFKYLVNACNSKKETNLIALLAKKQDSLQKILFSLRDQMSKCHYPHERVRVILRYQFLANYILPELKNGVGESWLFVLKELIFVVLQQLSSLTSDKVIGDLSLDLLSDICCQALIHFPNDLGEMLAEITSCLLKILLGDYSSLQEKAVKLLELLLVENCHALKNAASMLVPFPALPILSRIADSQNSLRNVEESFLLEKEMQHFIWTVSRSKNDISTIESLKHLFRLLKDQKSDLQHIINTFQEKVTLTEDVQKSTLHQLISVLIELCGSSNILVCQQAGCCLGEIGPIDLSTLALPGTKRLEDDTKNLNMEPLFDTYTTILHLLKDCLLDKDVVVANTVATVLKNSLGCPTLQEFRSKCPENKNLYLYFYPFWLSTNFLDNPSNIPDEPNLVVIDRTSLWIPGNASHEEWIVNLICTLIDSGFIQNQVLQRLKPVCKLRPDFCEKILPHMIRDALASDLGVTAISQQINAFFCAFCEAQKSNTSDSQEKIVFNKVSVQVMLNVVHYLRMQAQSRKDVTNVYDKMFWLKDLNYLKVAEASHYCSAPFASLLYVELWCDTEFRKQTLQNSEDLMDFEELENSDFENTLQKSVLSSLDDDQIEEVHEHLLKAYCTIGEPDGIYGCMAISMGSKNAQIHLFEAQREWNKLLFEYDMLISGSPARSESVLIQVLQKCGLHHTLKRLLQGLNTNHEDSSTTLVEAQCESAWRLGLWGSDSFDWDEQETVGFNHILCSCLNAASKTDQVTFQSKLLIGQRSIAEKLTAGSLESTREAYQAMSRFQLLNTIKDYFAYKKGNTTLHEILSKWQIQSNLSYINFDMWEPFLMLQYEILSHENQHSDPPILSALKECLETTISRAIQEKEVETAVKALQKLFTLTPANSNKMLHLELQQAKVYWEKKEPMIAKQHLSTLISKLDKKKDSSEKMTLLYAQALILYGKWQAETHCESYKSIMEMFFEKAVKLMSPLASVAKSLLWDAHLQVAQYAESQYKSLNSYINTDAYNSNKKFVKDEIAALNNRAEMLNPEEKRTLVFLERQNIKDMEELDEISVHCNSLCQKAVENYLLCLKATDEHDLFISRLIALWFQDADNQLVIQKLEEYLPQLPTYKFLPLIYQLAARMDASKQDEKFQIILAKLLQRVATDHPYHVLPIIFALCNADKDMPSANAGNSTDRSLQDSANRMEPKQRAAKQLIAKLKSAGSDAGIEIKKILSQMEVVCKAYISLAYLHVNPRELKSFKLPRGHSILKVKDFTHVPVLSEEIPVDKTCQYSNVVYIRSFKPNVEFCGGINAPKIIYCEGSNGKQHKQLVKGKDDIRQDAVMQQVFSLVNRLLRKNPESSKCRLSIRTYKVVPMSRQSGLIQWCDGTQPFGMYLIGFNGQGGAHKMYYPKDLTAAQCRMKMTNAANVGKNKQERYKVFLEVCSKFHPVFHYFFLEHFPEPVTWMERRLMYIRSVATSSIVGYILGLGDRHVQNILVDKNTAEMIHIDLGVAFDQGQLLKTPETVPFRLTRDVVDGMGIFGVEGTFRRCCEKTMEVMRNSQDALLTILEVLLHDPLYAWSLSPRQAMFLQEDGNKRKSILVDGENQQDYNLEAVNKRASHVLMRLKQKLQGLEAGVYLSVTGQVNHLIQQAQDPLNLSQIFPGWQPYI